MDRATKIAAGALVLLAAGGGAYLYLQAPARRVCLAMEDLCDGPGGRPGHYDDVGACVDSVEELSAAFGEAAIARAARCVDGAQSCAEGMTCMAEVATRPAPSAEPAEAPSSPGRDEVAQ